MADFKLFRDRGGQYRWTFRARNYEEIAVPGESFTRKDHALANIDLVKELAPDAPIHDRTEAETDGHHADGGTPEFEVYVGGDDDYRWRLQSGNNKVIAASSEGYEEKDDCLHAIDLVKRHASNAPVKDETGEGKGGFVKPVVPAVPKGGRFA